MPAPLLAAAIVLASAASPGAAVDGGGRGVGHLETFYVQLTPEGAFAQLEGTALDAVVDLRTSCLPDADGRCETHLGCDPEAQRCWATRTPGGDWRCVEQPDGSMRCYWDEGGAPAPGLACGDALSRHACALVPEADDSPQQACRRAVAGPACAAVPPVPAPEAGCREVFSRKVCEATFGSA